MQPAIHTVHEVISRLEPVDEMERDHLCDSLAWIERTEDIFRRIRPATPDRHLVSYVVVVDPSDLSVFLIDHVKAGLWLPTGGHVEPGENPIDAARREIREELGIDCDFSVVGEEPLFLTVTETVGIDGGHVDVSLWYVVAAQREAEFSLDPDEFNGGRWWSLDEILSGDTDQFDPHFSRFLRKLRAATSDRKFALDLS